MTAVVDVAVVDTNLFVSAMISPHGPPARLLTAWRQQEFELILSNELFDEIAEVLSHAWLRVKYHVTPAQVAGLLRDLDRRARRVTPLDRSALPVRCRDAKDDKLLACALGGNAQ